MNAPSVMIARDPSNAIVFAETPQWSWGAIIERIHMNPRTYIVFKNINSSSGGPLRIISGGTHKDCVTSDCDAFAETYAWIGSGCD